MMYSSCRIVCRDTRLDMAEVKVIHVWGRSRYSHASLVCGRRGQSGPAISAKLAANDSLFQHSI